MLTGALRGVRTRRRGPLPRGWEWRRLAPWGQLGVPGQEEAPGPQLATRGRRETGREVTSGRSGRRRWRRGAERGVPARRGGYRSALRPIVSRPRSSRRSRAREPGSSPARHLLPPLWKRPPPPRAARPGPRLRFGPARLTGRRQPSPLRPRPPPSWRGPGGPSRRHVRAPAAACSRAWDRGGARSCPGSRDAPGSSAWPDCRTQVRS
ncbi:uncharacterized protein LOC132538971 [Erinaceus europaeus]|uniref:Uncharacterized protein LOC132538971 n=1 Tax=Erinaceus europaeus TaxID=9365 RepID=A0ABM3XI61_ERIEU|nr:uncharacterized protein LOC132538971 [Erinaceus europaeus]